MTDHEALSPDGGEGLVRLRLDLAYDGTDFAGWAAQPGLRTVQGVLAQALGVLLHLPEPRVTCAGRTDAGVHARGQVAHVDVPEQAWRAHRRRAQAHLDGLLPPDVRVRRLGPAPPGFDARWSASSRRYGYHVRDDAAGADPLRRAFVVDHPRPLDLERLTAASELLTGEHDFAAFCRRREGASTVRTLLTLRWRRESDGLVVADVEADAFCHSMVRSLVGALLAVGDGRREPDWPAALLAGRERAPGVTVAPAKGLVLEAVRYPDDDALAAQAQRARRWRGEGVHPGAAQAPDPGASAAGE